uniref:Uncharacterized protein n=1 Tax=Rhizophora mucronata TaxID=61149 RepID=A0A2P2Q9B0_RHIMU
MDSASGFQQFHANLKHDEKNKLNKMKCANSYGKFSHKLKTQ